MATFLDLNQIVGVVAYFDQEAPPPPSDGDASHHDEGISPSRLAECDAGGGVWVNVGFPVRLTFDGNESSFELAHFDNPPAASKVEAHVIVTHDGLTARTGLSIRGVVVGTCRHNGIRYDVIRAGPNHVDVAGGKRAEVIIESNYFSFEAGGKLILNWAALEER